jgi:hypothetical protein
MPPPAPPTGATGEVWTPARTRWDRWDRRGDREAEVRGGEASDDGERSEGRSSRKGPRKEWCQPDPNVKGGRRIELSQRVTEDQHKTLMDVWLAPVNGEDLGPLAMSGNSQSMR